MIRKITTGLLLAAMTISMSANAQTADQKWGVGIHLSTQDYSGDLGSNFFKFENGIGGGIHAARYLSPFFDVQGFINYGGLGYSDSKYNFDASVLTANLNLKYKFANGLMLKEGALIAPYLLAGFGETYTKTSGVGNENGWLANNPNSNVFTDKTYSDINFMFGGGIDFNITEKVKLFVQTNYYYPLNDRYDGSGRPWGGLNIDGNKNNSKNDAFLQHAIGVTINLGKVADIDNDGVSDKKDDCPSTPAGVTVDSKGCAIDTDGDGVADHLDKCPQVAGLSNFKGCPDSDGDGVQDSEDTCPKIAGLTKFKGCPDTDGDGVEDSKDKCLETPKGNKVDANGCDVDTDKDGIPDYKDNCPKVRGTKANAGCPLSKEEKAIIKNASASILFKTSSSIIKKESYVELDKLAQVLIKNPKIKVDIEGHTDSSGDAAKNLQLSKDRAQAVKDYLVKKGFSANQITSEGYGITRPIESNETPEGRAKNRRVELVTSMFKVK